MLPELLAPVGGKAQLEAAVNNGADAVYMGGSLFNARINAENFTEESLQASIDDAHARGVKVYITFNTLIRDSELSRAFRYACRLYEMGADALIVQDMGLARLVHRYLPDFPLHLSTQGTVYNPQALELVKQMGFKRVVPARELSLEEIERFCAAAHDSEPLEVEVFVHGALCMCYSGQCQMSRAFGGGGRSGNRGLCAQPCRLPYTDDKGRTGYYLSPKDLCALELLPELIRAGVDSFKIEGRLKSPEYVAVVTAVYRKYLDLYANLAQTRDTITRDEWKAKIDPEDRRKLLQIFNRGGFTTGYLEGNPGGKILSGQSPKNQGIYIGKAAGTAEIGKKSRDKVLVDVKPAGGRADASLSLGDGVEIRCPIKGDEATDVASSSVVTFMERRKGGVLRVGDFERGIRPGDNVYKVTDKALREEALAAPAKKLPVEMTFRAHIGSAPNLELILNGPSGKRAVKVDGDFAVETALRKPTDEWKIKSQLMKLGDTGFAAKEEDIAVETDQDIMIPVSVINQMRRDAAEALAESLCNTVRDTRRALQEERVEEIILTEKLGNEDEVRRVENLAAANKQNPVPLQKCDPRESNALPYILNVSKGELDKYIEENFDDIVRAARNTGVLIGNPGWVKQFLDAGVKVYGDYGLNVYNSQSIKAYEELGVEMLYLSHETCSDGRTSDPRFGGRIPLMITEHPFDTDYLIDRKGVKHEIVKCSAGDKYLIF